MRTLLKILIIILSVPVIAFAILAGASWQESQDLQARGVMDSEQ